MHHRSDINDNEWLLIEPIIIQAKKKKSGPERKYSHRSMLNGIFYVLKTGCAWADLPTYYPPYKRVHDQFMKWQRSGVFDQLLQALRQKYRLQQGKDEEPTLAIIDSKTVQTIFNHERIGVDGHKKN